MTTQAKTLTVQPIGGPTAILELAGLRIVLDPTFDPPGEYDLGGGLTLAKLAGPAVPVAEIGPIDIALVSHDQHPDNLDEAGRRLLAEVAIVLTTVEGAERLGNGARGLEPYASVEVEGLRITAVPAQHGPAGTEHISGPVVGFVLQADGAPSVYVSGDNAAVDVAREIHDRVGPFDVAILNVGGAQVPLFEDPYVTLSNERAVTVAQALAPRAVVALHHDGWGHFTQDGPSLAWAFAGAGLGDRLRLIAPGQIEAV
jgi:L-ascorbate metabolism protein UlaG (beta-lactamase superfamily)